MNTGQTLLVTVGLLLFTIFILTVYRTTSSRFAFAIANEALLSGTALAQSLLDEISQKNFDEKTIGKIVNSPDSLTASNLFGPDLGENNVNHYDDIDDYHEYQKIDSLPRLGRYWTDSRIFYVNPNNPDQISNKQTFAKKIEVFVRNGFIIDTIKMYRIVTY